MTIFLRLLAEHDKASALAESCAGVRKQDVGARYFEVTSNAFDPIPGKPFAYWVSEDIRCLFKSAPPFECHDRTVRQGVATADDNRFVRCWWEVKSSATDWPTFSKGGNFSRFFDALPLVGNWKNNGAELFSFEGSAVRNPSYYFKPGLTWPLRSHTFCPQALPAGTVFSTRGSAIFSPDPLLYLGLFSAKPIDLLLRLLSGREGHPQYDMGDISLLPIPQIQEDLAHRLRLLAKQGWQAQRIRWSAEETSRAFLLPATLLEGVNGFDTAKLQNELERIQAEIDDIAFDLYDFSDTDRAAALGASSAGASDSNAAKDADVDEDEVTEDIPSADASLSWVIGVAFGRFDISLATGERIAPSDPDPFDPLPAKSPGMLPDGNTPFHSQAGILVDDPGHAHDLVRLAERVLERVEMPVPADLQRWLQKDFFPFHLQRYSKSRRKAPIYWPLATATGSYTLWLYYPSLTSQTLYTAINDFVEPKLVDVVKEAVGLKTKGSARDKEEEKRLEALTTLEAELIDLRDQLQAIAPQYQPNHDDGVQITAAPLWPLFRHKPWQKLLKDTWAKLQKGDYDWAHLAMNYWPERVREKCKTDKSLAIAHGLEDLYVEPEAAPKKARGRKKKEDAE